MVKLIEMVCTGNNGRSPVAELLAQNYLAQLGADWEYSAISSGTQVSEIASGKFSLGLMRQVIGTGVERRIYAPENLLEIREALEREDTAALKPYFDTAVNMFRAEELVNRTKVLREFGIPGLPKITKDQTVVRPDVIAIFPVDRNNKSKVIAIYQQADAKPLIEVLSAYATDRPEEEITNTFGRGEEFYRQVVRRMVFEVPVAIDRAINEL